MLPTQEMIDRLAGRIERAFRLRGCEWHRGCSTSRVWSAAALVLWDVHTRNPEFPLDPELFVASQPIASPFSDPWKTLADAQAGVRYRCNIRRIVRNLRGELKREIRRAEALLREGRRLSCVLRMSGARLSPLGLFITAHRAGRPDLAERLRPRAVRQHRCCPLYRAATIGLLPAEVYPVGDRVILACAHENPELPRKIASLN